MISVVAVVTPLLIAGIWYLDGRLKPDRNIFDFLLAPIIAVLTAYRSIQREKNKWDSIVYEFRAGTLVRELPDYPPLEITPGEITKIVESDHGITVQTSSRLRWLPVPRALIGYADFRNRLVVWAPTVEVIRAARSLKSVIQSVAAVLVCVALFGGPFFLMYTSHRELVLPLGTALTAGFVAMILYYRNSPHVPTSFRMTAWILLALPVLAMIERLVISR